MSPLRENRWFLRMKRPQLRGRGVSMASPFTELEVLTIMFSLLVFALFTLTGMLSEDCARSNETGRRPQNEELIV